jgi:hypothetical protein
MLSLLVSAQPERAERGESYIKELDKSIEIEAPFGS